MGRLHRENNVFMNIYRILQRVLPRCQLGLQSYFNNSCCSYIYPEYIQYECHITSSHFVCNKCFLVKFTEKYLGSDIKQFTVYIMKIDFLSENCLIIASCMTMSYDQPSYEIAGNCMEKCIEVF